MVLKIMEVNSKNLKEFNDLINKKNNTAIVKFLCGLVWSLSGFKS